MNNVKYFYIRDGKNFPHVCIAWKGDGQKRGGTIEFAMSTVNPEDVGTYTKARARKIAAARLAEGGAKIIVPVAHVSPITDYILDFIVTTPLVEGKPFMTKAHVSKKAMQLACAYDIYPLG